MKTAIILTGGLRSFDKCLPNLVWHVFRHFPLARYYVAAHRDEDAHKVELLGAKYEDVRVTLVDQPEMVVPEGCPAEWTEGKPYMHEPYHISVHPHKVLGQLWTLREGWKLYLDSNEPADLIIRVRPDLWFHSFEMPVFWKESATGFANGRDKIASTPWWGRFGGVQDRFALLGIEAAPHYFTTYTKIPTLIKQGCPLHPESLVAASLREGGAHICDDMRAEFSTLRKDGTIRYAEMTRIDMHYARGFD